jgi:hypothetical protein
MFDLSKGLDEIYGIFRIGLKKEFIFECMCCDGYTLLLLLCTICDYLDCDMYLDFNVYLE